jgi:non-specific serine/threonine protein kinase
METAISGRLPLNLSSFVGREHEIAQVAPLIVANRLVTLTGSGGAGKTRLAFEVAARLRSEFSEGIRVVELASLSDPGLVLSAVGRSAGFFDPRGQITLERLAGYLEDRDLLLILDNCEHLAAACAEFAQSLLRACCLDLRILCTSREPLGIPGEITWRVPPLAIPPSLAHIDSFDAVRLFIERAQAALPDFALTVQNATAVAEICRRLDGIPLAIELAAARVRLLTVEQIAQRLGDALGLLRRSRGATLRHRTMRAAIDWSYGSLDEPDARVLRRLSVFSGGATLAALECVCADIEPDSCEIVDSVARLVDKSLVIPRLGAGEMRYHMLEVIRQFAIDRLEERGEAELARERHLVYYLALAERIRPELRTPVMLQRLDLLSFEHDDLGAALRYCAQGGG